MLAAPPAALDREQRHASEAPSRTLLFFHIGRTGGTSLTKYFRGLTPNSYTQPEPADGSGLASPERFDFISGHYPVARWMHRVPRSWRTMMVIRNPIPHILSSYWHIRTHPEVIDNDGLRELIANARRDGPGPLLQARAGAQFEAYFDNPQTRFILNKTTGSLDADDQAHALESLDQLTYVGTTERLDDFAAAVAAVTPWADGWQEQPLPRAMVNPLNVLRTDEVPRDLLRRILAATEIDAALHQRAAALQSERFDPFTRPAARASSRRDNPSFEARFIPVSDMIRVLPIKLEHARPGHELSIDEDKIILHPPAFEDGHASVTIDDINLHGHSRLTGRLMLANERAAPVSFDIEISRAGAPIACASFKVAHGRPLDIRIGFTPTTGPARLTLRTAMTGGHSNAFAWATFVGLTID